MTNETMMQYFEWYLPNDGLMWKRCKVKAKNLADLGITHLWLPPAYKGSGQNDVGYGVYDLYDLGEFDQKGTVRTKYGTKEEYLEAIKALQNAGVKVVADIVLNQRMGADETEEVEVVEDAANDRNTDISGTETIEAWTKFNFAGRNGKYSQFTMNHTHFSGTDWDQRGQRSSIFRFDGKPWNGETDSENGNYDYLMGVDLDTDNPEVIDEMNKWAKWYYDQTGVNGFRLDAVKHIGFTFYKNFLDQVRTYVENDFFIVGEYWSSDLGKLLHYLDVQENKMRLFDVPLHFNFLNASQGGGNYPMKNLLSNSLVSQRPDQAVTFVDNHDTEPGQALQSFVESWFKPLAYAVILLRQEGIPCVFYGDYYGIPDKNLPAVPNLGKMIKIRKLYAYGEQQEYLENDDIIGWVRRGDDEHSGSGIAVVMSDGPGGTIRMQMGDKFKGVTLYDGLEHCNQPVVVGEDGWADFSTDGGNVAVWVTWEAYEEIVTTE